MLSRLRRTAGTCLWHCLGRIRWSSHFRTLGQCPTGSCQKGSSGRWSPMSKSGSRSCRARTGWCRSSSRLGRRLSRSWWPRSSSTLLCIRRTSSGCCPGKWCRPCCKARRSRCSCPDRWRGGTSFHSRRAVPAGTCSCCRRDTRWQHWLCRFCSPDRECTGLQPYLGSSH